MDLDGSARTRVIKAFSTREGWWYIGIKGDGGVKSKGIRLLIENEKIYKQHVVIFKCAW